NVSSTDTAGNAGTSPTTPGSFSTPASALVDSRRAEFAAGTTSGTWAGDTLVGPDGEVQLQPTIGDEFDGPGLSGQWVATPWQLGGTTSVAGGALVADTEVVHAQNYYPSPRTLEFTATFQAVNDQAVGFGN